MPDARMDASGVDDARTRGGDDAQAGFAGDGALAGGSAIVANAATYVFYAAATRALGVEDGGALLAVLAAALMCSVPVGVLGLGLSGVVSHMRALGDDAGISSLLRRLTRLYVAGAVALIVLGALGSRAVSAFFHVENPLVALTACLTIAAMAGLLLVRGFIQGLGEFRSLALSNGFEAGAKIAAAVVVVTAHARFGPVLTAFGAALLAAFLASAGLLYAHGRHEHEAQRRSGMIRRAIPVFTAMGAITVMTFFDGILARHYLVAHEAGLYNAAALAGRALMTVLAFVPSVLLPKIRERLATDGDTRAVAFPAVALTALVSLASLAVFAIVPRFVAVFVGGAAYADAAPLLPLYGVAASALAIAGVIATYHAGHDRALVGASLLVIMALEIAAVVLVHPSAIAILRIVVTGHVTALVTAIALGALDARAVRRSGAA